MGCKSYTYKGRAIRINEVQEKFGCLCTFPVNDDGEMTVDRLRSLAMLGAAVVMLNNEELPEADDEYLILPSGLPQWIIDGIDQLLPMPPENNNEAK